MLLRSGRIVCLYEYGPPTPANSQNSTYTGCNSDVKTHTMVSDGDRHTHNDISTLDIHTQSPSPRLSSETSLDLPENTIEYAPEYSTESSPESSLEYLPESSLEYSPESPLEYSPVSSPEHSKLPHLQHDYECTPQVRIPTCQSNILPKDTCLNSNSTQTILDQELHQVLLSNVRCVLI